MFSKSVDYSCSEVIVEWSLSVSEQIKLWGYESHANLRLPALRIAFDQTVISACFRGFFTSRIWGPPSPLPPMPVQILSVQTESVADVRGGAESPGGRGP